MLLDTYVTPVRRWCEFANSRDASSLTLTEVIKLKSKTPLPPEKKPIVRDIFKHEWIIVRQLDRMSAGYARELIWQYGFQPKDSVHVATAVLARVPFLDTFDADLIAKSGEIGTPPLTIGRPALPEQLELPMDADEDDGQAQPS